MLCPVCNSEHTARPRQCLQDAILNHIGLCGIGTEHPADCSLKRFNEYVETNPLWRKKAK